MTYEEYLEERGLLVGDVASASRDLENAQTKYDRAQSDLVNADEETITADEKNELQREWQQAAAGVEQGLKEKSAAEKALQTFDDEHKSLKDQMEQEQGGPQAGMGATGTDKSLSDRFAELRDKAAEFAGDVRDKISESLPTQRAVNTAVGIGMHVLSSFQHNTSEGAELNEALAGQQGPRAERDVNANQQPAAAQQQQTSGADQSQHSEPQHTTEHQHTSGQHHAGGHHRAGEHDQHHASSQHRAGEQPHTSEHHGQTAEPQPKAESQAHSHEPAHGHEQAHGHEKNTLLDPHFPDEGPEEEGPGIEGPPGAAKPAANDNNDWHREAANDNHPPDGPAPQAMVAPPPPPPPPPPEEKEQARAR